MCLAIPAQIIQLMDHQRALVQIGGVIKEISTALLTSLQVGEYVIIHVGYALTKLNEAEALKTLALFEAMLQEGAAL